MAFNRARSCNSPVDKLIIDESTEEILDYLLRSRNFLSDLTLLKLNQKVKMSLSRRLYDFLEGIYRSLKFNNSKRSLVIFLTVVSFAGSSFNSHNTVFAISNELKLQMTNISQDSNKLIPLRLNDFIENNKDSSSIIPVSEEFKDSLNGVKPGQPLVIIPQNSKVHIVKKGENLIKISNKYNVSLKKLISVNHKVDLLNLKPGQKLVIPDIKSIRDHRYKLASRGFSPTIGFTQDRYYRWPTVNRNAISSGFGYRGFRYHKGVDILGTTGNSIIASKSGVVIFSGWKGDYGQCVVIDHGYGIQTLYAHASKLLVKTGNYVNTGQVIAKIGSTGRATCPHLHFQIMLNGIPKNPEKFLRS